MNLSRVSPKQELEFGQLLLRENYPLVCDFFFSRVLSTHQNAGSLGGAKRCVQGGVPLKFTQFVKFGFVILLHVYEWGAFFVLSHGPLESGMICRHRVHGRNSPSPRKWCCALPLWLCNMGRHACHS